MTGVLTTLTPVTSVADRAFGPKALLIEDDISLSEYIIDGLRKNGIQVVHASDGNIGYSLSLAEQFDVLIVDRMLPGRSGLEIVSNLRGSGIDMPTLILSNLSGLDERVEGLNVGADDYLGKPFAFVELLARVNALLRRPRHGSKPSTLTLGALALDRLNRTVTLAGAPIALQPREFSLLERLLLTPDRIVTRTMLLEDVWHFNFDPKTRIVETHMSRLRGKLGVDYIQTVRGAGYLIRAPKTGN